MVGAEKVLTRSYPWSGLGGVCETSRVDEHSVCSRRCLREAAGETEFLIDFCRCRGKVVVGEGSASILDSALELEVLISKYF